MSGALDFEVEEMTPVLGTIVSGLDLGQCGDETIAALAGLLFDRGVVVIKDQVIGDAEFVRFARHFGSPLEFFIPEQRNPEFPEIIRISNDPATPEMLRDGAVHWHSDSSYETIPATVTMLYGREAPLMGGDTHFANTAAAFAALPQARQQQLEAMTASHELGMAPWIEGETPPDPARPHRKTDAPRHPLIMAHPVTGRKGIFTSGTAYAIEGMDASDATALIRQLRKHVVRSEFRTSYKVMPGDIVLWDNFGTVHCASPVEYSNEAGKRRLLDRISTKGLPG